MSELKFQRKVLDAIEAVGGKGYKASHRFMASIPDLHLTTNRTGPLVIECKRKQLAKGPTRLDLTKGQRQWLRDWTAAGGIGLIMLCADEGKSSWVWTSTNIELTHAPRAEILLSSEVRNGRGWHDAILNSLARGLKLELDPVGWHDNWQREVSVKMT